MAPARRQRGVLRSRSLWDAHAGGVPPDALADGAVHVHEVRRPRRRAHCCWWSAP